MLKRITKVTSLLITAASVVSMVPAMAADIQKVDSQEGTIYSAKAVGDGVFFINGEVNDDDDAVYYVTADGEYNKIDDLDSGDTLGDELFDHYLEIDDDTYVDEKDGYKVVDDNIRENIVDDAASAVRKKIKNDNDGRFDEDYYQSIVEAEAKRSGETSTFFDGFSGKWSHYQYKLETARISGEEYSTIYSDLDGNYIDGDYNLGNLKIGTTDDSVTIKNTEDTYEIEEDGTTYELKAEIKENSFLTEDYGDLYRTANLTIYRKEKGHSDSEYENITSSVKFGGKNGYTTAEENLNDDGSVTVLQKFSKEQASDDIDGIKYPKTSEIYFITDEDGEYESVLGFGDADRAGSGITGRGYGIFTTSAKGITSFYKDMAKKKVYAETVKLKSKNGYNYIDLSDIDDSDFKQVSISGGNVYVLDDGYFKGWDGNESFEKLYKVDGSMEAFSMSGKDNVILWNEDDEVYSIIYNKPKTEDATGTSTDTSATENTVQTGWTKNTDGSWTYVKADGTKATGWLKDGGSWYYLKADGIMATGWVNDNGTWYYLKSSGAMQTGWINDNGTWYYCNASGAMLTNTTVDGYVLGANGAWSN